LAVVLGGAALLLSGCSWSEVLGLGWPDGITPQAHLNRELWIGSVIASFVVGAIVWGLIFWASAFHRHKKGDTELPRQFGYNMPLELVLTVVPFLIISVLFYFTVVVQEKMLHKDPNPEVVIDVTAFQWNWKFGYQKVAFTDGTFNYDGADPARKMAVASGPEGLQGEHGGEFGVVNGKNPEDRSYLNFDKVEHRDPGPCGAVRQAHRVPDRFRRCGSRLLGAGVPVQARRDARSGAEQLRQRLPGQRDHQDRRLRRPVHGDVRHLPLDDELRTARG
jgi:heme/copper-type cytochrome/quinol oxidase subunit 2